MVKARDAQDVQAVVADAAATGRRIEIRGGGSKSAIGHPDRDAAILDMTALSAVIDYDPPELVLTVGAGARLADIQALVAGQGQMLAFEPFDHGPLLGAPPGSSTIGPSTIGAATIGGIVAAGVSGPGRLSAGAARDHMLGFEAVSGRGEAFVGGAKVVKNVTGYDLPKLITGSWGRLVALTQVTLKVLPVRRVAATIAARGLDDRQAVEAMARAMGSQAEIGAAAHLPEAGLTLLRIEGFGPSVAARIAMVMAMLPNCDLIEGEDSRALWTEVTVAAPLAAEAVLWRASVPPSAGPALYEALAPLGARRLYDWAGGLVWLSLPAEADAGAVRRAATASGGHATLVRAPEAMRRAIPALQPEAPGVAALSRRVRASFDPSHILDPDRFGDRHEN